MESSWLQVFLSWLYMLIYAAIFIYCALKISSAIKSCAQLIGDHNNLMKKQIEVQDRIALALKVRPEEVGLTSDELKKT